jgi:hypothetical protein
VSTIVAFTGFEFGTEVGAGAGPFDGTTGVAGTDFKVVAGTPVVGSYVGQVTVLNNKNYFWNTTTLGTGKTDLVVSRRFMFSTLPGTANDFTSIDVAASTDRAGFYYDPADQKVHAWINAVNVASSFTIAVNTWYTLQFKFSCSTNPNTLDWILNGVSQTQVSNGSVGATTIARYALGNRGGSTGVVNFDDVAVSVTAADHPLPAYQVRMVGVDTGGTTTEIGTANATVRFTANGTLDGTHSSAAILTALSEVPPLLGATSSGVAQQTAGAGNAVEIPMATYTLTGGETIAGCRLYLAGWAASALGANLGMRAWNGTAETILHGDTAATGFDSTTAGAWYAFMYGGVTDQTTLNALAVRMGYSTDVSPVVGAHAIYAELLIVPGAGGASIADVAGGGAQAGQTGPETISTVLADISGGGAEAGQSGPQATTVAVADVAGGGAEGGGRLEAITTVLNDVAGGAAIGGGSGPEQAGSSLSDVQGGAALAGQSGPETITTILADPAGGGAVGGGTANGIATVLADVAGGGAAAGGTTNAISTVLADLAGGGALSGGSGPESETAGGANPVTLADVAGGGAVGGGTIETPAAGTVVHDTMVMPILRAMKVCLQAQVGIWPNPPQLFQVRPGNAFAASADNAFDECCAGIAWVRGAVRFPTEDFPVQKTTVGDSEETDWAVQIEIGVDRCIPTQGDDGVYGSVVTGTQWEAATQQEEDDGLMLRKAACCLRDTFTYTNGLKMGNRGMIIGVQTPLENQGPCGGIMLIVTIRVPACDCIG